MQGRLGRNNLSESGATLRESQLDGWDSDKPVAQFNQLVISPEMIERIREAAAT